MPRWDDPLVKAMREKVESPEVRAACIEAAAKSLPALAGADPFLAKAFTVDYGAHNQTTNWAGRLVAALMRSSGYEKAGKEAAMPEGCIARSGELWVKRNKKT